MDRPKRRRVVDALPSKPIERPTADLVPKEKTHAARMRQMYSLIDAQFDEFEGRELDAEDKRILVSLVDRTRALMATELELEAKYGAESQDDVELAIGLREEGMSDEEIVSVFGGDESILSAMEKELAKDS